MASSSADNTQVEVTLVEGPGRQIVTRVPRPAPASIRQALRIARPPYETREYHRQGNTTEYLRVPGPPADAPPVCALCRGAAQSSLYATGLGGEKHYCTQCYVVMVSTGFRPS